MERRAILRIFQTTNKQNLIQEDLDIANKRKPKERNRIFSNISTKQHHKNKLR